MRPTIGHCIAIVLVTWMMVSTTLITNADELKQDRKLVARTPGSEPATGSAKEEDHEHQREKRFFLLPLAFMLGRALSGGLRSSQQPQPVVISKIPDTDSPYPTGSGQGSAGGNRRYPGRDRFGNPIYPYNPSGAGYPGINPLTGMPYNNPYLPVPNPYLPGTSPLLPGTNPLLPGANPLLPGTNPYLPGTNPLLPGTNPYLPGTNPLLPGTNSLQPGTNPYLPGANPLLPGTNPLLPGTNPILPGTNPLLPGTNPLFPGTNPLLPGTNPLLPGTNPLLPGTNPLLPGQQGTIPPELLSALNGLIPPNMMPLLLELLQNPNPPQSNALGDVLARLIAGLTGPLGKTLSDLLGNGSITPPPAPGSVPNNPPVNPVG